MPSKRTAIYIASTLSLCIIGVFVVLEGSSLADPDSDYDRDLPALAKEALSKDQKLAEKAIAQLRIAGPQGLDALFAAHQSDIQALKELQRTVDLTPKLKRLAFALDQVGQQKDCYASKLYWHTDIKKATKAAQKEKKPILSLRLLGKLHEEFSCANSRFFRTALYADPSISNYLRKHYILHWKSVRPVPKLTIDYGDGRILKRTITGNSIHYILDTKGRTVDAIPGLYGPMIFLEKIQAGKPIALHASTLQTSERMAYLKSHHRTTAATIHAAWAQGMKQIDPKYAIPNRRFRRSAQSSQQAEVPTARVAARIAVSKSVIEMPILKIIDSRFNVIKNNIDDKAWTTLANRFKARSKLSAESKQMIRRKTNPQVVRQQAQILKSTQAQLRQPRALAKKKAEAPLKRVMRTVPNNKLIENFESAMALDSAHNEFLFQSEISRWFADENVAAKSVDELNERVYTELFLTPSSDPWLGLAPDDVYTALDNGGVCER